MEGDKSVRSVSAMSLRATHVGDPLCLIVPLKSNDTPSFVAYWDRSTQYGWALRSMWMIAKLRIIANNNNNTNIITAAAATSVFIRHAKSAGYSKVPV